MSYKNDQKSIPFRMKCFGNERSARNTRWFFGNDASTEITVLLWFLTTGDSAHYPQFNKVSAASTNYFIVHRTEICKRWKIVVCVDSKLLLLQPNNRIHCAATRYAISPQKVRCATLHHCKASSQKISLHEIRLAIQRGCKASNIIYGLQSSKTH